MFNLVLIICLRIYCSIDCVWHSLSFIKNQNHVDVEEFVLLFYARKKFALSTKTRPAMRRETNTLSCSTNNTFNSFVNYVLYSRANIVSYQLVDQQIGCTCSNPICFCNLLFDAMYMFQGKRETKEHTVPANTKSGRL